MSNRLLWILIILWFIWAGYLYYNLKYLPNKQLEIKAQIIEQKKIKVKQDEAKKEVKLTKQVIDKVELTSEQKIQELKWEKQNYKTFNLKNGSKVYFKEENNKLDLYLDSVKIWNFDLVYPNFLKVREIEWSLNDLYIEVGNSKFYYNSNSWVIDEIDLKIDVIYVKKATADNLIFVTTKGSFNYSISNKTLEYFSYFNDYIILKDWYIWLVKKDEKRILNNLWFETENDSDLIVYYNPNTKEKRIINRPKLDIQKIYMVNDKLFISDIDWNIYELENLASNL